MIGAELKHESAWTAQNICHRSYNLQTNSVINNLTLLASVLVRSHSETNTIKSVYFIATAAARTAFWLYSIFMYIQMLHYYNVTYTLLLFLTFSTSSVLTLLVKMLSADVLAVLVMADEAPVKRVTRAPSC